MTDVFIKALAMKEMKSPCMEELHMSMSGVTGKGTQYLASFANLIHIDITKCSKLNYDDIIVIVSHCTKIKHFMSGMSSSFDDRLVI